MPGEKYLSRTGLCEHSRARGPAAKRWVCGLRSECGERSVIPIPLEALRSGFERIIYGIFPAAPSRPRAAVSAVPPARREGGISKTCSAEV